MGLLSAFALLCAGTAFAADWNFYGSARIGTFWTDSDLADETNLDEYLQGNSRIGANVTVSDELTGRFEYGASGGKVNVRLLYGQWNFGSGTFTVGQDYTPLYLPVSNQVYNTDNGLNGQGEPYPGRHPQLKLKFGGFQIAVVSPETGYINAAGDLTDTNVQVVFPRIEIAYGINLGSGSFDIGAGYNTFEYNDDEDIESYVVVARGKFQAAGLSIGAEAFYGQNPGNMVLCDTTGSDDGAGYARITAAGDIDDVEAYGGEIVIGYTFSNMFGIEAGCGYMQGEYDDDADEDKVIAYYLQAPITLAPGVIITPEVGVVDYDESGQDELTYFGAKWQINF